MPILGIESSAHTLGVGVVHNGKILASAKRMYKITDKGIIPARVADFHSEGIGEVIAAAMREAKIGAEDIDAIAYTKGPGLGGCLSIGRLGAVVLADRLNVPLIPVNHAMAHVEIARTLFHLKDPLAIYVSGGNSQILGIIDEPYRHYHIYGETFDIGIGNMFDAFARAAGLNPAWGSSVEAAAKGGRYIEMPYTVKGMDFAFTGLMTHAIKAIGKKGVRDVSYSLRETAFSMLCEAAERALLLTGKREVVLCGGVAQSPRLKEMIRTMCREHGVRLAVAPDEYNSDNGAMIAILGEKIFKTGIVPSADECTVQQRYRIDSVRMTW